MRPVLIGVALCGAMFAFAPVRGDASFDGYHLPKELVLAGLGVALVTRARPADRISALAWGLVAWSAVSALFATNGWLAWRAAGLTLAGVVLFEAARRLDAQGRERVLSIAVWATIALAAVAFVESQGLLPWLSRAGRAPGATVGQRNHVAHVLVIALPFVAARRPVAAVLVAGVIVLTRCRSAWLALPVALLAARQWKAVVFAAAGAAVAALLPTRLAWRSSSPLADSLQRLVDAEHGSGLGRLVQWKASLQLVARDPLLGVGPANWMVQYPTVSPPDDPSFQAGAQFPTGRLMTGDWVALLVERGAVALLAVVALAVSVARKAKEAPAHGTLAALAVVGTFDSVLQLPATLAMAAVLLGTSAPVEASEAPPVMTWGLRGALAAAAVYVGTLLAGFFVRQGQSFEHLEAAARVAPGDPLVRLQLGEAYVLEHRCADATPHLDALARQLPHHPSAKSLRAACGR